MPIMSRPTRLHACRDCGRDGCSTRGLCDPCRHRHSRVGTIHNFPRTTHSAADVVEECEWLAGVGAGWREAAAGLGYDTDCSPSNSGLRQALRRAGRDDLWRRLKEAA